MEYIVALGPIKTADGLLQEGATISLPEDQAESWLKAGIIRAAEPECELPTVETPPVDVEPEEITGEAKPEPTHTETTRKRGGK